jgi:hypothetical protein
MTLDPDRRAALLAAKLRALVRGGWGDEVAAGAEVDPLPLGAALRAPDGGAGWVLPAERAARSLGGALAWALKRGVGELHLVVDSDASTLVRRAAQLRFPVRVWQVEGRGLRPAAAVALPPERAVPADVLAWEPLLRTAGADPVAEHGLLLGEVLGLEVARVGRDDGGVRAEVGVGQFERELHATRTPGDPSPALLAEAVSAVRRQRRAGVPPHPANQLVPERWLRVLLVARPELAGAVRLAPVSPSLPRTGLRERAIAPALGVGADGQHLLAVASTGVDLDLVPAAADARLAAAAASGLDPAEIATVLVVPDGDDYPVTRRLSEELPRTSVRTVPRDWRRLTA